jgi:hypothetical protein
MAVVQPGPLLRALINNNNNKKYVLYSFPVISFCNSGVHYETPCIRMKLLRGSL